MLLVKNLTINMSGEPLFEKVSFVVNKKDRIGIVGPNGAGKSTLLKALLGEVEPNAGSIESKGERIGYLPQEPNFGDAKTVEEYLNIHADIPKALKEVELGTLLGTTLLSSLSGGQKSRLALAKLLLTSPSILLLDEPTNHLDIDGLDWLEGFVNNFRGGVMIVSHDRTLLDATVKKIIEIDSSNHTVREYVGGYTAYVAGREKVMKLQGEAYGQQQKEKKRLEAWIVNKKQEASVYSDPHKGKQIRAMEKRLQREILDQEIKKPKEFSDIKGLSLKGESANPKLILRCTNVGKDFETKTVLDGVSFEMRGKERVLLAGKNGSGKTTLLKIIAGEIESTRGDVKIGEAVSVGYFAQEHEALDLNKNVLEEFESTPRRTSQKDGRQILGGFLFSGETVFKKVRTLSHGERVRLIFAKLTNQENHLLILDEPTNHLDILSREVIENALIDYHGAILAVSHDRYFINRVGFPTHLHLEKGKLKE